MKSVNSIYYILPIYVQIELIFNILFVTAQPIKRDISEIWIRGLDRSLFGCILPKPYGAVTLNSNLAIFKKLKLFSIRVRNYNYFNLLGDWDYPSSKAKSNYVENCRSFSFSRAEKGAFPITKITCDWNFCMLHYTKSALCIFVNYKSLNSKDVLQYTWKNSNSLSDIIII